jgi:hypothetical protein
MLGLRMRGRPAAPARSGVVRGASSRSAPPPPPPARPERAAARGDSEAEEPAASEPAPVRRRWTRAATRPASPADGGSGASTSGRRATGSAASAATWVATPRPRVLLLHTVRRRRAGCAGDARAARGPAGGPPLFLPTRRPTPVPGFKPAHARPSPPLPSRAARWAWTARSHSLRARRASSASKRARGAPTKVRAQRTAGGEALPARGRRCVPPCSARCAPDVLLSSNPCPSQRPEARRHALQSVQHGGFGKLLGCARAGCGSRGLHPASLVHAPRPPSPPPPPSQVPELGT